MRELAGLWRTALVIGLLLSCAEADAQVAARVDVSTLLAKGHAAYLDGKAEAALTFYEGATAAAPGESSIHFYIGCALARLGRDDEAVAALQTALSVDTGRNPNLANRVGMFRGQLEERRQNWDAAATAYQDVTSRGTQPVSVIAAAKTRQEAIAARARLSEAYASVRQRIKDAP